MMKWRFGHSRRLASSGRVVVVGGGPSGLLLALRLGRWRVPCVVVEPRAAPSEHPKAHVLGARTMEILRELDVEKAILDKARPLEQWRKFRYCAAVDAAEDLAATDHARWPSYANLEASSPCGVTHVSQPKVEAVLRAALAECETVDVRYGRQVQRLIRRENWIAELDDGTAVEAGFAVGADGPRSAVRAALFPEGTPDRDLEGLLGIGLGRTAPALQHFVSIHFRSAELGQRLLARPAMLYFVFNAQGAKVVVAHDLEAGVFNLQAPFFPPLEGPADVDPLRTVEACLAGRALPSDLWCGPPRVWAMRARLEPVWATDTAFLVGDAAHEVPPSGGFGLNAACQDAHNLAWRLALVLTRGADPGLLAGYQTERRSAAAATVAVAVDNWRRGLLAPMALGASPAALDAASVACSLLPGGRQAFKAAKQAAYRAAFTLAPRSHDLATLLAERRCLPLFFPGVDLGLDCRSSSSSFDRARAALDQARHRDGAQPYVPCLDVGRRLPHFSCEPRARSSLDLVADAARREPNHALLLLAAPSFSEEERRVLRRASVAVLDARPADPAALLADLGLDALPAAVLVRPDGVVDQLVWQHDDITSWSALCDGGGGGRGLDHRQPDVDASLVAREE